VNEVEFEIAKHLAEFNRIQQEQELNQVRENPNKYKLTRLFPSGKTNYNYIATLPIDSDPDGSKEIRFCWSCWKNEAGWFLSWREIRYDTWAERDGWQAHRTRKHAAHIAEFKANEHDDKA